MMTARSLRGLAGGMVAVVTLISVPGLAMQSQEQPPAQDPPAKADAPPTTPPPASTDDPPAVEPKKTGPPPSLDELLGTGGADDGDGEAESDADATDDDSTDDPATGDAELDAALGQGSMDDLFQLALDGMRVSAERLDARRTDLDTQRTQEEIMRRLDMLIDQAQQQQNQQQSSSSSSSQQQQQQQNPGEQQSRSESDPSQQEGGQPENGSQENGESLPPGFQEGLLDGELSEAGSEWGSLPERIRDMLLQGRQERFSSLYERLTRSYYRRLAEEGSQ